MAERTILVIDDDEEILLVVRALLEGAGYEVVTATSGKEGLKLATSRHPGLILLDVMMPQLSGWEVCATLKNLPETSSIPVVILTVKSEIKDLITGMQVGADDFVTKPFTRAHLLGTVSRLLQGSPAPRAALFPDAASEVRSRNVLFDTVTELPTIPLVIDALRDRLLVDQQVGVLYVDVEKYSHVEDTYGWEVFDDVLREASRALKRLLGTLLSTEDLLAIGRPSGAELFVFLSLPGGLTPEEALERLRRKSYQLEETLSQQLTERFQDRIHRPVGSHVGHARIRYHPQVRLERVVYRALREALLVVSTKEEEREALLKEQFEEVLGKKRIDTLFQPIVELATGKVVAHEALSRGPAGSAFESPDFLFDYALHVDAAWALERICIASSARRFVEKDGGMLFVNVEAGVVHELKAHGHEILQPLLELSAPVVLEITERAAIRDFELFRESVSVLRGLGFRIAIDDAGSGYASLQSIAELRPAFVKIANTLVSGLDGDPIKRDVVEMLVGLARRTNAKTVAEGIEREEELAELKRLGVDLGQGFLLGRPAPD